MVCVMCVYSFYSYLIHCSKERYREGGPDWAALFRRLYGAWRMQQRGDKGWARHPFPLAQHVQGLSFDLVLVSPPPPFFLVFLQPCCSSSRNVIVIDMGTGRVRAGFGGDGQPLLDLPNVCGHDRHLRIMVGDHWTHRADSQFGDQAHALASVLVKPTLHRGAPPRGWGSWDAIERVLYRVLFEQLMIEPSDFRVIITQCMEARLSMPERYSQVSTCVMVCVCVCVRCVCVCV